MKKTKSDISIPKEIGKNLKDIVNFKKHTVQYKTIEGDKKEFTFNLYSPTKKARDYYLNKIARENNKVLGIQLFEIHALSIIHKYFPLKDVKRMRLFNISTFLDEEKYPTLSLMPKRGDWWGKNEYISQSRRAIKHKSSLERLQYLIEGPELKTKKNLPIWYLLNSASYYDPTITLSMSLEDYKNFKEFIFNMANDFWNFGMSEATVTEVDPKKMRKYSSELVAKFFKKYLERQKRISIIFKEIVSSATSLLEKSLFGLTKIYESDKIKYMNRESSIGDIFKNRIRLFDLSSYLYIFQLLENIQKGVNLIDVKSIDKLFRNLRKKLKEEKVDDIGLQNDFNYLIDEIEDIISLQKLSEKLYGLVWIIMMFSSKKPAWEALRYEAESNYYDYHGKVNKMVYRVIRQQLSSAEKRAYLFYHFKRPTLGYKIPAYDDILYGFWKGMEKPVRNYLFLNIIYKIEKQNGVILSDYLAQRFIEYLVFYPIWVEIINMDKREKYNNIKKINKRTIENRKGSKDKNRPSSIEDYLDQTEYKNWKENKRKLTGDIKHDIINKFCTEAQAEVINLKIFKGLTEEEIGYKLGISQQAVNKRITNGLKRLKPIVIEYMGTNPL